VPESGQVYPNVVWHYHTGLDAWYKERWNEGQRCTASMIDDNGVWLHADESGKIYQHSTVFSFDGQPINAVLRTPFLNFGDARQFKRFQQCALAIAGFGESQLGVLLRFNYGSSTASGGNLVINNTAFLWGGGLWNNDGSYQWGNALIRRPRFYLPGYFTNVQLVFTHNSITGPVQFFELGLDVEMTGTY
jgi:hypothetical protein